jgi:hypothetical protein
MTIRDEPWFDDPFAWYEKENYPEIVGIKVTEKVALDFLQALYQIYKLLERNDRKKAMEDAKQLAILLLASAFDYAEEAIDELNKIISSGLLKNCKVYYVHGDNPNKSDRNKDNWDFRDNTSDEKHLYAKFIQHILDFYPSFDDFSIYSFENKFDETTIITEL